MTRPSAPAPASNRAPGGRGGSFALPADLSALDPDGLVEHPWGFCETLVRSGRFRVNQVVVRPGGRTPLQCHHHRSEHWIVVGGVAAVSGDGGDRMAREGDSIHLPPGSMHSVLNPGVIPLTLIEVQTGSYLGADDAFPRGDGPGPV